MPVRHGTKQQHQKKNTAINDTPRATERREKTAQDLSEVEQALATCVAPPPAGNAATAAAAAATTSLLETARGGLDGDRNAAATAAVEGHGVEAGGGGGGGASQGDPAAVEGPPPPPNPFAATDVQGGSADYMDFVRVRGMVSRKAAACFRPGTFLMFPRDIRARVPAGSFFKHVYESVTLQKTRLTLQ